jgi:hypothetical protein
MELNLSVPIVKNLRCYSYLFHADPLYVSNTLDTVTIMIVMTPLGIILGNYKFLIPFNVISEEFNKNKATILEFTTKI